LREAPVSAGPEDRATGRGYVADYGGAARRGFMRASDADRERVVDALKAAFVHGLLTKDELGMRAGQALAARTCGELASIAAGIPVRPTAPSGVQPPRPTRAYTRQPVPVRKKVVRWSACVIIPPALGAAFLTYYGGFVVLFLLAFAGAVLTAGPVRSPDTRRRW
jgi:Domain of unknown function (DUF1707)